jgi:hypothetical protein
MDKQDVGTDQNIYMLPQQKTLWAELHNEELSRVGALGARHIPHHPSTQQKSMTD